MASTGQTTVPEWTVGDRIAKARRSVGLEQWELAERVGVDRSTVSKWELDLRTPRARHLMAVSRETQVPVEWLCAPWELNPQPAGERVLAA